MEQHLKSMIPPFLAYMIAFVFLALTGCGPNHRYFYKQNIELVAGIERGIVSYGYLSIGTPDNPFDTNLNEYGEVLVELAKDDIVPLQDLTVEKLEKTSTRIKSLDDVGYDTGWPKGSKYIDVKPGLYFVVNDDRILKLTASTVGLESGDSPPRFGRNNSKRLYAMPFDHEQVLELFGQPDKTNDIWHK